MPERMHLISLLAICCFVAAWDFVSGQTSDASSSIESMNSNHDSIVVNKNRKPIELGSCQVCRHTTNSVVNAYKAISRKWSKQNKAEMHQNQFRLLANETKDAFRNEIKQIVCEELTIGKEQCRTMFKLHQEFLNHWVNDLLDLKIDTSRTANVTADLILRFCVQHLQLCCADGHFGPSCRPCPIGSNQRVCAGNGQCKGDGTRKGSGKCTCAKGYRGEACDTCADTYFSVDTNDRRILCETCDKSCQDGCVGLGPKQCNGCKAGYFFDSEYGCLDINECLESRTTCKKGTFCVNTEGSHICYDCDKACNGCHGDGPDMCDKCAKDYRLENNVCLNRTPSKQESSMEMSRYFTYVGLCLATCIIFHNNMLIASVIGFVVATYIGVAEYTVGGTSVDSFGDFMKNFLR